MWSGPVTGRSGGVHCISSSRVSSILTSTISLMFKSLAIEDFTLKGDLIVVCPLIFSDSKNFSNNSLPSGELSRSF